jgi:dTDP-glucose 4,6-dehydratase
LSEQKNIDLVKFLCRLLDELVPEPAIKKHESLIKFVTDRPGHDLRYAIKPDKMMQELGWQPQISFQSGMRETVKWYLNNREWCARVLSGEYRLQRLGLRGKSK